jgi:hypothetical protein
MTYRGPTLEDLQDDILDATCMAALGDSIRYKPAGGSYFSIRAYVEYPEAIRDIETGSVIEQDITVDVLMTDVPARPSSACRVRLGRMAGLTFKPINIRRDRSGSHWQFDLEKVNA